ncbi:MAG: hypothetical protein IKN38_03915 [Clostridia bacterium]|nr:hypothetical protein [Clostridia bacterium]
MIRRRFARFMIGRYGSTGIDKLGFFLIIAGFVLYIPSLFTGYIASRILNGVQIALYLYFFYRLFSRNFTARQKENRAFCKAWDGGMRTFKLQKDRIKDRKDYRYKKCPSCKAILRLPAKRGRHSVKCPKCGERFDVNNIF